MSDYTPARQDLAGGDERQDYTEMSLRGSKTTEAIPKVGIPRFTRPPAVRRAGALDS